MSKEIDQKVVEMRFDNKHFEQNVSTTMSSIRKLEESLKFKGATKGFDELDKSARKVDMTHLGKGLESVQAKFSALQVIGVTALANITNSALNAGKRIASALTIEPVKTGFNEYELKMNSIQTIMASTGEDLKTVNKYLNELNEYSDKTIYSFSDMTQNIGKFTNAGVKLEDAVSAIKGVSNVAAVSGANANEASRAMYNFAQALSAGYVKLIDWKSIELANMGTVEFKQQLIDAAVAAGTLKDAGNGMYKTLKGNTLNATKNFNETLTDQWMTTEVLVGTLKDYSDETTEIGKKASKAATRVTTFSKMMDTLKETAQSGWAKTWEIIFGDFEEGTNLWTSMNDVISGVIGKIDDFRNNLLEGALGKTFTNLSKKIKGVTKPIKDVSSTVKNVTDTVKNYGDVVNKIIDGEFGNGKARIDALTKAGYDWAHAQNLVNEKLGSSTKHATKYKEAQKDVAKTEEKLTETEVERLEQLAKMSDAELKALGYSKKQIKAFRELKKEADKLGMSVGDFVKNIDKLDGRTILINSFKNIGQGLVKTFKAIGDAWKNVFDPITSERLYDVIAGFHKLSTNFKMSKETATKLQQSFEGLFSILKIVMTLVGGPLSIAIKLAGQILGAFGIGILDITAWIGRVISRFNDWLEKTSALKKIFTPFVDVIKNFVKIVKDAFNKFKESEPVQELIEKLKDFGEAIQLDDGASENFKKITDGLVTLSTKLAWVLNASLLNGLKVLGAVLNLFGVNLMDVGAAIVDYLGKAKKWVNENIFVANTINEVAEIWKAFIDGIKDCWTAFKELKAVQKIVENFKNAFKDLKFEPDLSGFKNLINEITNMFSKVKDWIKSLDDSENIGLDIVKGLANGLTAGAGWVISKIVNLAKAVIDTAKTIFGIESPSKVFFAIGGFLIAGLISGLEVNIDSVKATIVDICTALIQGAKGLIMSFCDYIKNIDFGTIIGFGLSVGVLLIFKKLVDAIEMFANPFKKLGGMFESVGGYFDELKKSVKRANVGKMVLSLAISVGILALSARMLADVPIPDLVKAGVAIVVLCGVVLGLAAATKMINGIEGTLGKLAFGLMAMAAAIGIIAWSMKSLSFLTESNAGPILDAVELIGGILLVFAGIAKIPCDSKGLFGTLVGVSIALFAMAKIVKIFGTMTDDELKRGMNWLAGFAVVIGLLIAVGKIGGSAQGLGPMFLGIGTALLAMVAVAKIAGGMTEDEWLKGIGAVAIFTVFVMGLMAVASKAKLAEGQTRKLAGTLFGISIALLAMVAVAKIAGGMTEDEWLKGIGAVAIFTVFVMGLMAVASKIPADVGKLTGTLTGIAICMTVMAVIAGIMGFIPLPQLAKGVIAVGILGAVLAAMMWAAQYAKGGMKDILAMTAAIAIMAGALAALSFIPDLGPATTALVTMGLLFSLMSLVMSQTNISVKEVLTMSAVIAVMAGALYLLGQLPVQNALASAGALAILMLSLTGVMAIISNIKGVEKANITLLAMTAVIAVMASALYLLAMIPVQNALASAGALAILMLSLSASMLILSNMSGSAAKGAGSLLVIAAALAVLTPCLMALSGLSLTQVGVGLLALAGALTVIGLAGHLLNGASVGLLSLGGAVALIGAGCLMAGTGVLMFTTALNMFLMTAMMCVGQGPVIAAGMTAIITGVCAAIVNGASAITTAIVSVVLAITQALITSIPAILDCLNVMITSGLAFLVSVIPKFVIAGMKLIKGILQGIANNIGGIVKAAIDIVVNFINAISSNIGRVIDAGIKLMISFINGLANGIRNNQGQMISAINNLMDAVIGAVKAYFSNFTSKGKELIGKMISGVKSKFSSFKGTAKDMMDGFIKGVKEKFSSIKKAAVNAIKGAVDGVKSFLGIKSPSRVFMKIGRYTDEGFALGLKKYAKLGVKAAKNMGEGALEGLKDVLGVNSPATEGINVGAFLTEGFAIGIEKLKSVVAEAGTNVGSVATKAIGEGIKKDMTAEEQAKKKADNIANAFKTKFDEISSESKKLDLELELGVIGEDEHFEKSLKLQGDNIANAWAEYQQKLSTLGADSQHTKDAYNAYLQELVNLNNIRKEEEQKVLDSKQEFIDELDSDIEIADLEHEVGKLSHEEAYAKKFQKQAEIMTKAHEDFQDAVKKFGKDSKESKEAYSKWLTEQNELDEIQEERQNKLLEDREGKLDRLESINELEYEIWSKLNDETASESEKAAANLNMLTGQYNVQLQRYNDAEANYRKVLGDINATAEEIEEARIAVLQAQSGFIDAQKELETAQKESTKNTGKALLEYNKFLNENKQELLKQGLTDEEITEMAKKWSGYDPNATLNLAKPAKAVASTITEQVQNGVAPVASTTTTLVTECAKAMSEHANEWEEAGKQLANAFVAGINETLSNNSVLSGISGTTLGLLSDVVNMANSGRSFTPMVRPVLGTVSAGNAFGGMFANRSSELARVNANLDADRMVDLTNIESKLDSINESVRGDVVSAINDVRSDFGKLAKAIDNIDIRMDSDTVVGELINKIDGQLGQIANHKGRGN